MVSNVSRQKENKNQKYVAHHFVTLFVNSRGGFAETDLGSALAISNVYRSEKRGNLLDTARPVLLKEP